jgi:hypothetical protein
MSWYNITVGLKLVAQYIIAILPENWRMRKKISVVKFQASISETWGNQSATSTNKCR